MSETKSGASFNENSSPLILWLCIKFQGKHCWLINIVLGNTCQLSWIKERFRRHITVLSKERLLQYVIILWGGGCMELWDCGQCNAFYLNHNQAQQHLAHHQRLNTSSLVHRATEKQLQDTKCSKYWTQDSSQQKMKSKKKKKKQKKKSVW